MNSIVHELRDRVAAFNSTILRPHRQPTAEEVSLMRCNANRVKRELLPKAVKSGYRESEWFSVDTAQSP